MGSSSSSNDSSSNSHPKSWLFPEDDYSTGAHAQAAGTGGIIGDVIGGIAGPGGAGAGLLGGAVSGGIGGAGDSSSNSHPKSWLFPEDDHNTDAYAQEAGAGGIVGLVLGGGAGAAGGSIAGSGGAGAGFLGGAVSGGIGGAGDALVDKYNQFHPNPSCEVGDYVEASAIKGGIGALGGALGGSVAGPVGTFTGAVGGGLTGAANGFVDKYNQCHPNPSCQVGDYVESAAIKGGIGAIGGGIAGASGGPVGALGGAVGGGLTGAATGFIDKYNQCHP
ncbi:hypothetical protein [Bartonella sp. TT119HLJHH]|uniref:hypothetical protein n=1 Tax=Bartonella sp. TT119HLJHH TaxID=3243579 RepID=UPI0035CEF1CF